MEKQEQDYNLFDWWKKVVFNNYANFSGRARRSEFWYYQLGNILLFIPLIGLTIATVVTTQNTGNEILMMLPVGLMLLTGLALIIPSLAVIARRLHDTGRSGWFYLISLIPFGGIVLLIFYCEEGKKEINKWGEDPKNPASEIHDIGITRN